MKQIKAFLLLLFMMVLSTKSASSSVFQDLSNLKDSNPRYAVGLSQGKPISIDEPFSVGKTKMPQRRLVNVPQNSFRRVSSENGSQVSDFQKVNIQLSFDSNGAFLRSAIVEFGFTSDSLSIKNFNGMGDSIKAFVNFVDNKIDIKSQKMYLSTSYGRCNIVPYDALTNSVDTLGSVTGVIDGNSITLSPWCCLIMEGTYKGYLLGDIYYNTTLKPTNTLMKNVALDADKAPQNEEHPVLVEQVSSNLARIYNFSGISSVVDVQLRGDKTLYISPTLLFQDADYGYFYCYPADWTNDLYFPSKRIVGKIEGAKMTWGNWIIQSSNGKYYHSRILNTELNIPFELSFPPVQAQAGFKGAGTEEDPYLIETAADLIALSDSVNMATIPAGAKYVDAFKGKYFKQTAAINMKDYKFPPIGGTDEIYRFAGIYDGNNKTISNLNVETGNKGYCALFGAVDTCGVLKNIKLTSPISKSKYYYTGTIGAWCQGTVENCSVTNGIVEGLYCVGGVFGIVGPASQVSFTGTVSGESQVGGVAGIARSAVSFFVATATNVTCTGATVSSSVGGVLGYLSHERNGSLSDSYFSGKVLLTKSGQYGGTIAGISVEAPIMRCFSVGEIHAIGSIAQSVGAGIVGAVQGAEVSDCYFAGNMNLATSTAGSIMGYVINVALSGHPDHSSITNCYVTGTSRSTTTADYAPYVGRFDVSTGGLPPVITNCKYDKQRLPLFLDKAGSTLTSDMTAATAWDGYDSSIWTFTDKLYPKLTSIATNACAYVAAAPLYFTSDEQSVDNIKDNFTGATNNSVTWKVYRDGVAGNSGNGVTIATNGNFTLTGSFATDTIVASSGTISKWIVIKSSPMSMFEGNGTEENPYLIKTKEDLIKLSDGTSNNNLTFDGSYFKMTNDIDLEYDTRFQGIASNASVTYAFGGIFDGGNFTIHRCKLVFGELNEDGKPVNYQSQRGFISRLKAVGIVKNLRMSDDCDFTFYSNSGGIVGYNYGKIINCRNYAQVKAYSGTIGGITGYSQKGSVIKDCYNAGKVVAGYFYAGGIVGICYGAIENCQNDGEVSEEVLSTYYAPTKLYSAAGICHSLLGDGSIKNVLNTGYVHSYKYVGGILATYNGTEGSVMAEATLNTGMLNMEGDDGTIGNVVGKIYKKGVCKYNYYDNQVSTYSDCNGEQYDNSCGSSTDALTSGNPLPGLDPALWTFKAGEYPTLTMFADEPMAQAAAKAVVKFDGSMRSDSIKHDAALSVAENQTWTLASGAGAFKIENALLVMDPNVLLSDTLVVSNGKYIKRIPVVAVPDTVMVPEISVVYENGAYNIAISSATPDAKIYYTLDSSEPTSSSILYAGVITNDSQTGFVVKAIASKHNYYDSAIAQESVSATGVDSNFMDKEVLRQVFIDASGLKSANPFNGLNVVVTTFKDGTVVVAKQIIKVNE